MEDNERYRTAVANRIKALGEEILDLVGVVARGMADQSVSLDAEADLLSRLTEKCLLHKQLSLNLERNRRGQRTLWDAPQRRN